MKRVLSGIVIILSCICLFVLSSCGTYRVENEEQSIKTYICPNDNMFGLEKVVVFENSVVAVFDKEICDRSDYGSMSYDEERVKYPAYANYMNVSTSRITESTIDIKKGKYVVSMSFEYDEADKFNPDEDVEITGFNVLGMRVTFYDGDIELFYSIEGGECFDDFRQVYSQSSGKWGDIENELVSWPLIKPDDINDLKDKKNIYCFDSELIYDYNDDSGLKNGIRTIVNDSEEEKEFIDSFFDSDEQYISYEYPESTVYLYDSDGVTKFLIVTNHEETEYPESVCGLVVDKNALQLEAVYDSDSTEETVFDNICDPDGEYYLYADCLRPYADYQETYDYVYDEGEIVSYKYSHDSQVYGTYNSSGTVYLNENRACYKEYYVTSGGRSIYWFYDENGKLFLLCDFGGMAYKGMEDDPETEIGVPFQVYYFE